MECVRLEKLQGRRYDNLVSFLTRLMQLKGVNQPNPMIRKVLRTRLANLLESEYADEQEIREALHYGEDLITEVAYTYFGVQRVHKLNLTDVEFLYLIFSSFSDAEQETEAVRNVADQYARLYNITQLRKYSILAKNLERIMVQARQAIDDL